MTRSVAARGARRLPILAVAVAGALLIASAPASAQCAAVLRDGDFEEQSARAVRAPWVAEGAAGIDVRNGFSQHGANNAWARNMQGWNAIRQRVRLSKGTLYTLKAFVRTSGNARDGYFGFRDFRQRPVKEIKFGALGTYRELMRTFRPAYSRTYNVFAGFWAPGQDAWIQVDNVRLEFPCNDVALNPVIE